MSRAGRHRKTDVARAMCVGEVSPTVAFAGVASALVAPLTIGNGFIGRALDPPNFV